MEDLLESEPTNLEAQLNAVVLGQETATKAIVEAIELRYRQRTLQSGVRLTMVFIGPPSTGKTLTARTLAQLLCRNEKALLELDLSLMERRYSLSQDELDALIGVKPPYIGWERGGTLTNHALEFPRSVIYVRGIEHAPPTVANLFRQIIEQGYCIDGRGQHVNFREAIIIFAHELGETQERRVGFSRQARTTEKSADPTKLMRQLQEQGFPEAILGTAPALIVFQPLSEAARLEIARREMESLRARLQQMEGKSLEYDDALLHWLATDNDGAPLSPDAIQRRIQTELTAQIKQRARSHPDAWANATVVRLTLPPAVDEPAPPLPRVLVIDDVDDFYNALKGTFPDWHWRWADTEDRADALLSEFQPHLTLIDVCLSEHDPHNTQGVGMLQRLKKRFPQQTFVIVSAQGDNFATTRDAFRAGAYDYLLKGEHSLLQELVNSRVQLEHEALKATQHQRVPAEVAVEMV
jgi:CheY-like chemotaxis protein